MTREKMSQLDNGKIPKNIPCPYSTQCGSCKIDACNGRGCPVAYGKTIKHDFSCAAARGLDMIFVSTDTNKYFCDGCGMDLSLNGCICDPEYKV